LEETYISKEVARREKQHRHQSHTQEKRGSIVGRRRWRQWCRTTTMRQRRWAPGGCIITNVSCRCCVILVIIIVN